MRTEWRNGRFVYVLEPAELPKLPKAETEDFWDWLRQAREGPLTDAEDEYVDEYLEDLLECDEGTSIRKLDLVAAPVIPDGWFDDE